MPNFKDNVGYWVDFKDNTYLAFVYVDFSLQERGDAADRLIGVYGQGRVYPEILETLRRRTRDLQHQYAGVNVIWLIHFAPFECGWNLRLIDYNDVTTAASSCGVSAILCGHTHSARKDGSSEHTIYCGGSAGCVDSENDARIHVVNV